MFPGSNDGSPVFPCWGKEKKAGKDGPLFFSVGELPIALVLLPDVRKNISYDSALLSKAVFQNHRIDNLATVDAPPPEKRAMGAIKFFKGHHSTAPKAVHFLFFRDCPGSKFQLIFARPPVSLVIEVTTIELFVNT